MPPAVWMSRAAALALLPLGMFHYVGTEWAKSPDTHLMHGWGPFFPHWSMGFCKSFKLHTKLSTKEISLAYLSKH